MKVKTPSQTAGPLAGKQYEWVGHFRSCLNEGHNDGPRFSNVRKGSSSTADEQSERTSMPITERDLTRKEFEQNEERWLEQEYKKEKK